MKALHYITGDTQQSGFRRIGGSVSFPADTLPYLNNREPISEQARVSSGSNRAGGGGLQQLRPRASTLSPSMCSAKRRTRLKPRIPGS